MKEAVMEQLVIKGLDAFKEFCLTFGQMYWDSIDKMIVSSVKQKVKDHMIKALIEECDELLEAEYPHQSNKLAIAIYNKNEKVFWLMMKICINNKYFIWQACPEQAINEYINVLKMSMRNNT